MSDDSRGLSWACGQEITYCRPVQVAARKRYVNWPPHTTWVRGAACQKFFYRKCRNSCNNARVRPTFSLCTILLICRVGR
jgi:hypothetical protein